MPPCPLGHFTCNDQACISYQVSSTSLSWFFSQYRDICPLWNIVPYRTCAMESSTVSREKMKKPAHVCKIYDGTSNSQNLSLKLEIHDSLHHLHFITYRIILLFKQVFVAADSFDAGTAFAWSSPGDKNQDPSTCT